ncbi:MAG: recombinase family protein [Lachnospiraceae bacterium]|nr:recombinase family protein [Bacteroides fragilis]MCM1218974.1 recombinase family protein [Lachnospiraceae bacterium]
MKLNVAYLRVSTEAQTEKYGLDVQKQKILEYCEKNGVQINRWYIDGGYSGSKLERPEIQRLLDDCQKGEIGMVFVYKLDRLSRDTVDTLNLINNVFPSCGVRVVSMTEDIRTINPMDKVMVTMNAAMNQYEREVIYMRTRAGMVERVKKGLWPGGGRVPIGYYYDRNDGLLHPNEDAEKVRQAYKMYLDGYSCDKIAKALGFKKDCVVSGVLKKKSNIGLIEYKGEVYQGKHEPIVNKKIFYEVQKLMKKRHTNSHVNNDNMLTGLCYCGVCGARMRYQKWGKYHKIVCYSQQKGKDYMIHDPNCNNKKVFAENVEMEVESCFREFAISVEKGEEKKSKADLIAAEINRANTKIKKLYGIYLENESENVRELIKDEENRVKELKKQLSEEREKELEISIDKLERVKHMSEVWDELTNRDKNRILKECVERIVITNDDIDICFTTF